MKRNTYSKEMCLRAIYSKNLFRTIPMYIYFSTYQTQIMLMNFVICYIYTPDSDPGARKTGNSCPEILVKENETENENQNVLTHWQ